MRQHAFANKPVLQQASLDQCKKKLQLIHHVSYFIYTDIVVDKMFVKSKSFILSTYVFKTMPMTVGRQRHMVYLYR